MLEAWLPRWRPLNQTRGLVTLLEAQQPRCRPGIHAPVYASDLASTLQTWKPRWRPGDHAGGPVTMP